ncbi:MAG: hypothetical protein P9L92_04990 [Candidatus Electryonea clarkiae]|nr:hypothetical protein [Candidatus Electryonea clarkiae]MDP8287205.1 hypothetical protein [Candidatus Electryonea clarkiae]
MKIQSLLTHVHPDLDAILSIYLMRSHESEKFPGAKSAFLQFVSANTLPDGKSSAQLELEGTLALDVGGGRFDTHPVPGTSNEDKWDTCASQLVAVELGVKDNFGYRFILPFALAQDVEGRSLTSKDAAHHLLAPHSILEGVHRLPGFDDSKTVEFFSDYLDALTKSAELDEPGLSEIAALFDRSLNRFLLNDYKTISKIERKTVQELPIEGDAHKTTETRGWEKLRELEKLLRIGSRLLDESKDALPSDELERRILLPNALYGLAVLLDENSDIFRETVAGLFQAVVHREADWFAAVAEVKRSARLIRGQRCSVVAIASKNGLAIKAARYSRRANSILYYQPKKGHATIQAGYRPDGKPVLVLKRIAARIRTAEQIKRGKNKPVKNAGDVGTVNGWFLHPSLQLLNCGSPKAPDVQITKLTYSELIEQVEADLRPDEKIAAPFCPPDTCTETNCAYYPLRLPNCSAHRKNLKTAPKKGTLGDLFGKKLKGSDKRNKS